MNMKGKCGSATWTKSSASGEQNVRVRVLWRLQAAQEKRISCGIFQGTRLTVIDFIFTAQKQSWYLVVRNPRFHRFEWKQQHRFNNRINDYTRSLLHAFEFNRTNKSWYLGKLNDIVFHWVVHEPVAASFRELFEASFSALPWYFEYFFDQLE